MKVNLITYDQQIPEDDRDILESRADVFARSIQFKPAFWTFVEDHKARKYYQLKSNKPANVCHVQLTLDEIRQMPDSEIERIIIAGERPCFKPSEHQRITKEYVENRITEWVTRLDSLFDQVQEWVVDQSEWMAERSIVRQQEEELMRLHRIPPRQVPFLTLWADKKKNRVSLVPSALWIIGADGRVNITTNKRQFILVDRRNGHDGCSDWQILSGDLRRSSAPFNRNALLSILQGAR
jgi:hypothetical protein